MRGAPYLHRSAGGHSSHHSVRVEHPQPARQGSGVGPSKRHPLVAVCQVALSHHVFLQVDGISESLSAGEIGQVGQRGIGRRVAGSVVPASGNTLTYSELCVKEWAGLHTTRLCSNRMTIALNFAAFLMMSVSVASQAGSAGPSPPSMRNTGPLLGSHSESFTK